MKKRGCDFGWREALSAFLIIVLLVFLTIMSTGCGFVKAYVSSSSSYQRTVVTVINNTPYLLKILVDGVTVVENLGPGQPYTLRYRNWTSKSVETSIAVIAYDHCYRLVDTASDSLRVRRNQKSETWTIRNSGRRIWIDYGRRFFRW